MKHVTLAKTFAVSCAIALAACNSNGANRNANNDADNTGSPRAEQPANMPAADADRDRDSAKQPITVTGCLQEGDGHTYILTKLNEPSQKSVGTTGNAGAVQREQMRAAANSYRVDASGDVKMDDMVGKQVRVSGTVAEKADLPKDKDSDKLDVKEGDIAKIDASSVTVVSANCK